MQMNKLAQWKWKLQNDLPYQVLLHFSFQNDSSWKHLKMYQKLANWETKINIFLAKNSLAFYSILVTEVKQFSVSEKGKTFGRAIDFCLFYLEILN